MNPPRSWSLDSYLSGIGVVQKFLELYLANGGNGVDACRGAGYKGNANVLHVQASRLLRTATVQEALRARTEKALKAIGGPTVEQVMRPPRTRS